MVFKGLKGMYELVVNFKDAFNQAIFEEAYIEECFDKYSYIVGDLSDGLLRLKGFSLDSKSNNYFKNIKSYIEKSCVFEAPYYVLKRIKTEEEYNRLKELNSEPDKGPQIIHCTLEKENFDRESLVLESSGKGTPKIEINPMQLNKIPKGILPSYLKNSDDTEEKTVSVISSSDGFVPQQRNVFNKNKKNNQKNSRNHRDKGRKEDKNERK